MNISKEQQKAFSVYAAKNKIDKSKINNDDAIEFIKTGAMPSYFKRQEENKPISTTDNKGNEKIENNQNSQNLSGEASKNNQATITPNSNLNFSEEEKKAALEKSRGMTDEQKKVFAEQLKKAQEERSKPVVKTNADKIKDTGNITNIEQFKAAGGTLENLSSLIGNAYGVEGVTIKNNKVYGVKNGVPTTWTIDEGGNPIATSTTRDRMREEGVDMGANMNEQDVFHNLMNNTTEGLDTTTAEYTTAKRRFNNYNKQDKSQDGFYLAMKNGTFDKSLLVEYNKNDQYANDIKWANERLMKEHLDDTNVKSLLEMKSGEVADYVKNLLGEFGFNTDYKKQLEDNKNLQTYKKGVLDSNLKAAKISAQMKNIRANIDKRYPGATEGFKNAIFNKENSALKQQFDEAVATAAAYKGSYDLEIGEIDSVNTLNTAQSTKQLTAYNDIINKQIGIEVLKEETKIKEDFNTKFQASNKKLTQKTNKDGDLVFFDNKGNEVKRYKGFSKSGEKGDEWSYKATDNGWIGIKYNDSTGKLNTKSYNKEGNLIRQYGTYGNMSISEGITGNVPDRNNNPFNVKNSPLAKKILGKVNVDEQGHIIFNTPEEGLKVGLGDIEAKLSGKTNNKAILNGIKEDGYVSLKTLGKGWAEDDNWAAGVASILGTSVFTNASKIDKKKLAAAIAQQEGYTGKIKATNEVSQVGNDKFVNIKPKDYSALSSLNLGMSTVGKIEKLIDKTDTGFIRAYSRHLGSYLPEFSVTEQDRNFDKLSALTIDTLANYVKSISGATVSDKERENLEKVLPTPSDNKETFKIKLETFKSKMNEILTTEGKYWGFKNVSEMQKALGIDLGKGTVYDIK